MQENRRRVAQQPQLLVGGSKSCFTCSQDARCEAKLSVHGLCSNDSDATWALAFNRGDPGSLLVAQGRNGRSLCHLPISV